jgi:CO/xanthine dehydrogenase FAD-binding subunit
MLDKVEAFHRPGSIREALRLLHSGNSRARIVAGGTDVVLETDRSTRTLIDITHAGLNYVRRKGNACHIGATTTLAEFEASPIIRGLASGILAQASAASGSVQLRNLATLGGKLASTSQADTATPLLALNAEIVLADQRGRRKVPLTAIYSPLRKTILDHALIVEIVIPAAPRAGHWRYHKLARTEMDVSLVNLAAGLQLDSKGRVKWARIAIGSVDPTPVRAAAAEERLIGNRLDEILLHEVCDQVAREVAPASDLRASAEYRRTICRVLARRALEECAGGSRCIV